MGKWVVCAAAAVLFQFAGEVSAAPYVLTADSYSQDFEGLSWTSTTASYSNFGQESSNTVGWVATNYPLAPVASYYPRNAGRLKGEFTLVGGASTTPADKAVGRYNTTYAPTISLFLKNGTNQTINDASVAFTLELWVKPTATISNGIMVAYDVGDIWTTESAPYANTDFRSATILSHSFPTSAAVGAEYVHQSNLRDLNWAPGQSLAIMWQFSSSAFNANHIVGIDDVLVVVPEPAVVTTGLLVVLGSLLRRQRVHFA